MQNLSTKLFAITGAALMFAGLSFGQTCNTTLGTTGGFLRAEGQNEIVPSFNFTCTAGATAATLTTQFFLSPAVTVTSAVTNTTTGATEIMATSSLTNTATVATVSGSTITFSGLSIAANQTATFTVTNVRVNATSIPTASGGSPSNLAVSGFASGANVTPGPVGSSAVIAYVLNGLSTSVVSADPQQTLTNRINNSAPSGTSSAVTSYGTTTAFGVCNSLNNSSTTAGFPNFFVKVTEGFVNAFKAQGTPSTTTPSLYAGTESTSTTQAISNTRFKVVLTNIPTGLNVYAPVELFQGASVGTATAIAWAQVSETASTAYGSTPAAGSGNIQSAVSSPNQFSTLLNLATYFQQNNSSPVTYGAAAGLFQVAVSNNTASIVYEVTTQQQGAIDSFIVPVYLQVGGSVLPTQTASMSAAVSFAPVAAATVYPSFAVGSSTTTSTLTSFTQCSTTMIFPFVSNASGFETGIAISNTTLKSTPAGFLNGISTSVQSGVCNLAFYGQGGTNPSVVQAPNTNEGGTAPYASAESYAFTLSQALAVNSANPATFTGFMIAQCNFQYAHGFAYITYGGLGTPNAVAMGYLAEVVGRGTNSADSVSF